MNYRVTIYLGEQGKIKSQEFFMSEADSPALERIKRIAECMREIEACKRDRKASDFRINISEIRFIYDN